MRKMILTLILVCVFLVSQTSGYKYFEDRIPNGYAVPHPCKANLIWHGVGHMNPQGGGARNPFGIAFQSNGYKWTQDLCKMDSDGDGKSNGYELGDPDCTWKEGQTPSRLVDVTHPGFCDPVKSEVCKDKDQSMCNYGGFSCSAVDNGTKVKNMTVKVNRVKVPAEETTYMCQFVKFPTTGTYDIIASQPRIDNQDVMHHIVLWGCPDNRDEQTYATPRKCGMATSQCRYLLFAWTLGSEGHCLNKDFGVRIGQGGWKYAIIQTHWNNPQLLDTYYDGSGLLLHYTPVLRPEAMSTMILGVTQFIIPPGKRNHIERATLHGECSRARQKQTLKLRNINLHMHYLGTRAQLEHFRDGKKIADIVHDNPYAYDFPVFHDFEPPVEYRVGDELRLTCEFDSSRRKNITVHGDATSDEMCFAFIGHTPYQTEMVIMAYVDKVDMCTPFLPQNFGSFKDKIVGYIGNSMCHVSNFKSTERPYLYNNIKSHCNKSESCNEDCLNFLQHLKNHPCSTDSRYPGLTSFIYRFHTDAKTRADKKHIDSMSNSCMEHLEPKTKPPPVGGPCVTGLATEIISSFTVFICSCFVAMIL